MVKTFYAESGQGLVEYAFILVLVAIVVYAALSLLGPTVGNMFTDVNTELEALTSFLQVV
ncbi:MAG: Flp family type IVb pilin [Anaerolineae bacterium]|nr:Flp family type IVb pilin [Anaerolineae bacterium]MBT7072023.1 Flp family type IVb pilin [Anaerolineae bacterium]MBT7324019.1 Flp family type IVb pilin [Anaerolineae bacterium]